MTDGPIYLDYNATTPLDPRVFEAMTPWFLVPSNAGSRTHTFGQSAREAVQVARQRVADVIDAQPEEIFFTSGATESNNIAILGITQFGKKTGRKHIISTRIEHKAVLEPLQEMERRGFEVELVEVSNGGYVEVESIREKLRPDTLLVAVMHANNETGVLQPVDAIAALLDGTDIFFHTDAAQTFGKEAALGAQRFDSIAISGHKIFGPQGVGALFLRRNRVTSRAVSQLTFGGGQERNIRPGTLPVPLIVGLGRAAELAMHEGPARREEASAIKMDLIQNLAGVDHVINGDPNRTQPHVLNVRFPGIDSEAFMMAVKDVAAVSNGSACTSSSYKPSHVLLAMGLDEAAAEESIRLSWGYDRPPQWHTLFSKLATLKI